jgi:hypothetical protein
MKRALFLFALLPLTAMATANPSQPDAATYVGSVIRETRPAALLTPPPMRLLESASVTALRPAVRLNPPTPPPGPAIVPDPVGLHGLPFAPPGLSNCEEMTYYRIQAGLPPRFDAIGWRESNCINREDVKTFCCYGYWQLSYPLHAALFQQCEVESKYDINGSEPLDKQKQACSAKLLFDIVGYQPWSTTS